MKQMARFLATTSAAYSLLTLIQPRRGWAARWLSAPKMLAGGWTPLTALTGGLGVLIGWLYRDRWALAAGLLGAAVSIRHILTVSEPRGDWEAAFGPDWAARIPPTLPSHMLSPNYQLCPDDPPDVPWQRDVVVGQHIETGDPLLADVWQPPHGVARSGLALLYLHGSAWHYLDKDIGTRRFFRHLAGQGHVVVDVAYTLVPRADWRGMLADVRRAIAWTKAHAAGYGADPQRVVLVGGSAGAHLALLAAYTAAHPALQSPDVTGDTSVHAVVAYYPLVDLAASGALLEAGQMPAHLSGKQHETRWLRMGREQLLRRARFLPPYGHTVPMLNVLEGLLGGTYAEVPENYHLASPIEHVGPHCPPTLLLQGAHDLFGMAGDVRRLYQALREAGVPAVHVEFPDTDHAFDLFFPKHSPAAQAATCYTDRFLALMS